PATLPRCPCLPSRHDALPILADLVDRAGDDSVLDGRRAEVVVIFCDLRGFTAFSAALAPEEVMGVLSEYYEALGKAITQFAATLDRKSTRLNSSHQII